MIKKRILQTFKKAVTMSLVLLSFTSMGFAASPLGFRIGETDYDTVKNNLSGKIMLFDAKPNKYSGGKVLVSDAPEMLGIDGLQNLAFVFDPTQKLTAVIMKLSKNSGLTGKDDKSGFLYVYDKLKEKYRLLSKDLSDSAPTMQAQFKSNDVYIQMNAPVTDNLFELRYLSERFIKRYHDIKQEDKKHYAGYNSFLKQENMF